MLPECFPTKLRDSNYIEFIMGNFYFINKLKIFKNNTNIGKIYLMFSFISLFNSAVIFMFGVYQFMIFIVDI